MDKVEMWRKYYDREQPHGVLGNLAQVEFIAVGEAVTSVREPANLAL